MIAKFVGVKIMRQRLNGWRQDEGTFLGLSTSRSTKSTAILRGEILWGGAPVHVEREI